MLFIPVHLPRIGQVFNYNFCIPAEKYFLSVPFFLSVPGRSFDK